MDFLWLRGAKLGPLTVLRVVQVVLSLPDEPRPRQRSALLLVAEWLEEHDHAIPLRQWGEFLLRVDPKEYQSIDAAKAFAEEATRRRLQRKAVAALWTSRQPTAATLAAARRATRS